jgi:hypothetical protein
MYLIGTGFRGGNGLLDIAVSNDFLSILLSFRICLWFDFKRVLVM